MTKEVRKKRFLVCSKHFLVLLLGKCLKSVHCFVGSILIEDLNNPSVAHKRWVIWFWFHFRRGPKNFD